MVQLEQLFLRNSYATRVGWRHDRSLIMITVLMVSIVDATTVSAEFRFYKSHPNGAKDKIGYGESLVINCTTNDPTAKTSLYLKKEPLQFNEFKELIPDNKDLFRTNDVFKIRSFGSQYSGLYQCRASNENNIIKWEDPSIAVEPVSYNPEAKISMHKIILDKGENFNLSCTISNKNVAWFKTSHNQMHVPISRDRIGFTWSAYGEMISYVIIRNAAINDSGQYVCVVTEGNKNASSKAEIKVFEPKPPKKEKMFSFAPIGPIQAPSDVHIDCAFSGHPFPTIKWYKDGKEIQGCIKTANKACTESKYAIEMIKTKESIIKGILRIPRTNYNDSGSYMCVAVNSKGNASVSVFVDVGTAARIVVDVKNQVIITELGTTVNITCQAVGQPTPTVSWIRNKNQQILVQSKSKAILSLKSINVEDLGNYTCNATNFKSDYKLFTVKGSQVETKTPRVITHRGFTTKQVVIVVVVCVSVMLVIFVGICIILYHRQKKARYKYDLSLEKMADYQFDPDHTLLEQCRNLPYDPDWEFPEERLVLGETLGSGAFGLVLKAEAIGIQSLKPRDKSPEAVRLRSKLRHSSVTKRKNNKQRSNSITSTKQVVAVKTLKDGANKNDYTDLASELKILIYIAEHENIINILGACTRGRRLMVIIEFAPHGDLLSFLRQRREIYEPNWIKTSNNLEQEFSLVDLAMAAYQISRGMEFLASRKCIHRDLAARNVLVGSNYVMKISDFGLARDIYQDDMYVKTSRGLLPIKWMALESLFDRVYTHMSDVWSFGIVLWEIFTLGGTPYPSVPIEQLMDFLEQGKRMPQPGCCPTGIYNIMLSCWNYCPPERPAFMEISRQLEQIFRNNVAEDSLGYLRLNAESIQYRYDCQKDCPPQEDGEPAGCSSTCEQLHQNAAKCTPDVPSSAKKPPSSPSNNCNNNNNHYSTRVSKKSHHNEENPLLNHESTV